MKDKRITMKDVAKEAGVSTATVSYVLNYSDTERISHETRLRVFEAANKLNYVPNMAAKALSEKKSYLVGMIINKRARSKKSKIYQYYDLADEIRVILHALGYDMFLISAEEIEEGVSIGIRRTLDAVFIVDLEESLFKKIANKFFVPAIFIDGYVADPLFCKVLVDSKELLDKAQEILGEEFYVVSVNLINDTKIPNKAIVTSISSSGTQSPSQGNVHHMIMPASNSIWYTSTVSSASSGHYNIDVDDGIPVKQKWSFKYNALATAKSTMRNVKLTIGFQYDLHDTDYKTYIR